MNSERRCTLCIPIRYLILMLCMAMGGLLYLTRVNLNVTIVSMVNNTKTTDDSPDHGCPFNDTESNKKSATNSGEFNWDPKTQGLILGAFFYGYVLLQIIGGRLAEVWGAKWLCGSGLLLSGIINVLTPTIAKWNSIPALVASRVILGMAQSVDFPAGYALLIRWFPDQERSTALGLFTAGSNIGAILTMFMSGWLSSSTFLGGWPSVFYTSGFAAGVWFVLWMLLVYSEPKDHPLITKKEIEYIETNNKVSRKSDRKPPSAPWRKIITSKTFIAVTLIKLTVAWNYLFVLIEVPSYLQSIHHYPIAQNGLMMSLIYGCMALSLSMGGITADWIIKKNYAGKNVVRKGFEIIAACGSSLCLALIPLMHCNRTAVIALFMVGMLCLGQISGGDIPFVTDITSHYAATVIAIANSLATFAGFLGPQFVGLVIQSDKYSQRLWSYVFYFSAAINSVTIIIFLIFGNAERQSWDIIDDETDNNDNKKGNDSVSYINNDNENVIYKL